MQDSIFWQPPVEDEDQEPERPIWERMIDADGKLEPPRAYECFEHTRRLGLGRSILESYRQVTGKHQAKQVSGTWNGWIARWRWQERFAASDADDARERLRRMQVQREKAEDRIAALAQDAMERAADRFLTLPDDAFSPSTAANALNMMARLALYAMGKADQYEVELDQTHRILYEYIQAPDPTSVSLPKSLRPADGDAADNTP